MKKQPKNNRKIKNNKNKTKKKKEQKFVKAMLKPWHPESIKKALH